MSTFGRFHLVSVNSFTFYYLVSVYIGRFHILVTVVIGKCQHSLDFVDLNVSILVGFHPG